MLDIRYIRDNPEAVQQNAINKKYDVDIAGLLDLDIQRRKILVEVDDLRAKRNEIVVSSKGSRPTADQVEVGKRLKQQLSEIESRFKLIDADYLSLLKQVPNMSSDDVPVGLSEDENVVIKTVGSMPQYDFEPKNHYEIAEYRNWIDKTRAAKVTGSRFAYIMNDLVKLQFAIIQFVLDTLTDEVKIGEIAKNAGLDVSSKQFVPILPPLMIRTDMYDAMDRLEPRDDRYKLEGDDLWLQGSAEHVLGSMHAGEVFDESELPIRYVGYATSFRREAGTYGKDMEGILRMHQFDKLEMESFTKPEDGPIEHLLFIAIQEHLLKQLELPYQVIKKCTADIGKPNASGVDMEVWLPGQNKYRETHTADYMTDYQARRLQTRYRRFVPAPELNPGEESGEPNKYGSKVDLIHTNDATAFALGRIMIAIIENYQTVDNKVNIPTVLQPYLSNRKVL